MTTPLQWRHMPPCPSHTHTHPPWPNAFLLLLLLLHRPANPAQCRSVPIAHFRSSCGACQGPIAPPVPQAACPHTTFYRCLLCPATAPKRCTSTPDLCAGCFLRRAPLPNPHPAMPHTFIMAQLGPSSLTWLPPAPPLQQAQPTASLPTHLIASLQGRELGDGDYDLLLQLDAPNRRATSLPHYLLSLLAQPAQLPQAQPQAQPQAPEAGGEQAEGGQEGAEESHEAPEQEEAQVRASTIDFPDPLDTVDKLCHISGARRAAMRSCRSTLPSLLIPCAMSGRRGIHERGRSPAWPYKLRHLHPAAPPIFLLLHRLAALPAVLRPCGARELRAVGPSGSFGTGGRGARCPRLPHMQATTLRSTHPQVGAFT